MTQSTDSANHRFDPMAIPGLSRRAREAVNGAFEAILNWRSELADNNEKNIKRVIEKMAAAAAELGWPEQVVDAARTQLQNLTEMQIKTMDQMMDAWEEQLKLPDPTTPSAMLSKMKSSASPGSLGSWRADGLRIAVTTPLQLWMNCAGQWQKSWADMMTTWTKAAKSSDNEGSRRH